MWACTMAQRAHTIQYTIPLENTQAALRVALGPSVIPTHCKPTPNNCITQLPISVLRPESSPNTVTFLNGEPAPGLFVAVPQPSGPPLLYVDPGTLFPSPFPPQPGTELTRSGIYSSGLMLPSPESGYTLIIGDMKPGPEPYLCLLHDESGMKGTLIVLPK